jgi:thiamine biosynthesis protein ThiI
MAYIICHYGEIGLKGKNRKFFEEKLIENIKKALPRDYFSFIERISGRILIGLTEKAGGKEEEISGALKNVFGLVNFAFAKSCRPEIEEIKKEAFEILRDKKFQTFKIATQRSEKRFPLTSQAVNERVGEYILKKSKINLRPELRSRENQKSKIKVDLEKPDVICFIEIVDSIRPRPFSEKGVANGARKYVFLYLEKIPGPGGLPVTTGGKAVALLSGGIDSPVAAYFVMKRGVKIIFLHFHAYPFTKKTSIEKVKKIVEIFKKYQFSSRLYLVPFADLQKEMVLRGPAKLRMILYRRTMLKIAEEIARKEGATALVTGESIGQVASQTLENIKVIDETVDLPVFRPLIGFDKEEIIKKAKEIDTFNISILPHEDCCSRFLPKHPETRANLEDVKKAEKKIPLKVLVRKAITKAEIKKI